MFCGSFLCILLEWKSHFCFWSNICCYIYMCIAYMHKFSLVTDLCFSEASSHTAVQCLLDVFAAERQTLSGQGWHICHCGIAWYGRSDAECHLVYLSSTRLLQLLALLNAPERRQKFWSVPACPSLFSENISLSRPQMSLRAWDLEDTSVRQDTHKWGDQLFYFWRYCPSSQKANLHCISHRGERTNVPLSVLGGLFVLPWNRKVCDCTHEKRRNPPHRMPA